MDSSNRKSPKASTGTPSTLHLGLLLLFAFAKSKQLSQGCTVANHGLCQEMTPVAEVCGEKTFRETTKTLLNRYQQTCQTELMVLLTEAVPEPVSFRTSKTSTSMTASETQVILLSAAAGYQTRWLRTCRCHWPLWLCSIWLMKKWVRLQLPLEFWFAHVKTHVFVWTLSPTESGAGEGRRHVGHHHQTRPVRRT